MADRAYTDGFPEGWSMVHRDDCTLLVRRARASMFAVPSVAICQSPKLMQGEAWLGTAKEIAHAMAGSHERELTRIFAEFCDSCGIGPPYEEDSNPRENIRSLVTWKCDRCDHTNLRPKATLSARVIMDGRTYRKFIPHPGPVDDGTLRCIACGQIDEEEFHDPAFCPACPPTANVAKGSDE